MSAAAERLRVPVLDALRDAWHQRRAPSPALIDVQQRALDSVLARGLPTREEAWKYTNLRRFGTRAFVHAGAGPSLAAADLEARLVTASGWHRLVLVDGRYRAELSTPFPAARHVTVRALSEVAQSDPERVERWIAPHAAESAPVFAALNAAFIEDGLVVELGEDGNIAEPLYVVHVSTARDQATLHHDRVVIEAGSRARAILIEHHVALGDGERYGNSVTDARLASGARLEHYRVQEEGPRTFHFARLEARLAERAELADHRVALGAALDRTDIEVRLEEPHCQVWLHGLFLVDATRHADTHTRVDHLAPSTTSDEDYRGIACERGRGVFNGKVVVHPDAQHVAAHQTSRNLLLSKDAEIDTKPELEIYADDVKCSHGATTGQLDAAALFYLRSRGIDENDARALLARAFAARVVDGMSVGPLREHLDHALFARFRGPAGGDE